MISFMSLKSNIFLTPKMAFFRRFLVIMACPFHNKFFLHSAACLFFVCKIQNRLAQKHTLPTKRWLERFSIIWFCERIDRQWSLRKRRTVRLHTNILEMGRSDRLKSRPRHKLKIMQGLRLNVSLADNLAGLNMNRKKLAFNADNAIGLEI